MVTSQLIKPLQNWWKDLSNEWKSIFIDALELERPLSTINVEDVLTITEVDCNGRNVKDLSPLRMLKNLQSLDISETHVRDLSPLKGMLKLRELHADGCCIAQLDPLVTLPNLEVLDISYPISDFRDLIPLTTLKNLRELYCNDVNITSMQLFYPLRSLKVLCLFFNNIPKPEVRAFKELFPACKVLF